MSDDTAAAPPTPAPETTLRPVPRWQLALVFVAVCALYLPKLGSYTLWDPWEGHYAEVARRMLEEHDWLRMRWQSENFFSKPALTFWLMATGMKVFGVGEDGGWSGEFVASHAGEWGLRLPFALFGILGIVALWYTMMRLVSRRAAWFTTGILATTPYYFFISRQAITDMPSCGMLIGSLALFALVIHDPRADQPLKKYKWGLTHFHLVLAAFALLVFWQLGYFSFNERGLRYTLAPKTYMPGPLVFLPFAFGGIGAMIWAWFKTKTNGQVLMYWFYLLNGLAVLAKGPVAPGLAGLTILCYLALTGDWKLLKKCEIPRGVLMAVVICLPWHFAMYIKDGMPWLNEYLNQHLLNRAFKGVHGDRGSFRYFFGQLGIGMWPWVAFVPMALARLATAARGRTARDKTRLLLGIWAVVGFFFFSVIATKFHHYVLPAVPAMAALVAIWFDDMLAGEVPRVNVAVGIALALLILVSLDLVPQQSKLVQLYIYRYDRMIPKGAPWNIDYERTLFWFAIVMCVTTCGLFVARARKYVVPALIAVGCAWTIFCIDVLMIKASPHFGQRTIHEVYFKRRAVHGIELSYTSLHEFAEDWSKPKDFLVHCYIPETMHVGDPMRIGYEVGADKGELHGQVAKIGDDRFWIAIPDGERQRIAPLVAKAQAAHSRPGRRWEMIDADRMISKLYWRGESLYLNGEIWHSHFADHRAVFHELNDQDNKKFLEYLKGKEGQKMWVAAERGHLAGIHNLLPTARGKETWHEEDTSSSAFFGLASFTL